MKKSKVKLDINEFCKSCEKECKQDPWVKIIKCPLRKEKVGKVLDYIPINKGKYI